MSEEKFYCLRQGDKGCDKSCKLKELEQKVKDHVDWSINEESIEVLEKKDKECAETHIKYRAKFIKEISELRAKVSNPEWLDVVNVVILKLMEPQLTELKEQIKKLYSLPSKMLINKAVSGMNREVLREHYRMNIKWGELYSNNEIITNPAERMEFYREQIKKLSGEKSEKALGVHSKRRKPTTLDDSKLETCEICNGTGVNIHREREHHWAAWKDVSYQCQCQREERLK